MYSAKLKVDRDGHVLGEVEGSRHLLVHIRLDDGDIVGRLEEEVVVVPAGRGVGHINGRDGFHQAAAGDDRHIPGPVRTGQGLQDYLVDLLQFLHEEGQGIARRQTARGDLGIFTHTHFPPHFRIKECSVC